MSLQDCFGWKNICGWLLFFWKIARIEFNSWINAAAAHIIKPPDDRSKHMWEYETNPIINLHNFVLSHIIHASNQSQFFTVWEEQREFGISTSLVCKFFGREFRLFLWILNIIETHYTPMRWKIVTSSKYNQLTFIYQFICLVSTSKFRLSSAREINEKKTLRKVLRAERKKIKTIKLFFYLSSSSLDISQLLFNFQGYQNIFSSNANNFVIWL